MPDLWEAARLALALIVAGDPELVEIVARSLAVSLSAVAIACLAGFPLGALLAVVRFPGRRIVIVVVYTLMSLPPVFVGLLVYVLLSRSGPLGVLGLMFTPTAMVIAQAILVGPIVTALAHRALRGLYVEYRDQLCSLGARPWQVAPTLLVDGRTELATAALAGFGRAIAEVGAVLIVGGNIAHVTRVMTTTIALETSKGNLALAMALGLILLLIALAVNAAVLALGRDARGT
ncbi:MAG: ABC transporter permease [Proteobacteria bacterium]|nr:ABC transporter permease [Pseudomonadota bacterium]